jgi:hypothetical protein
MIASRISSRAALGSSNAIAASILDKLLLIRVANQRQRFANKELSSYYVSGAQRSVSRESGGVLSNRLMKQSLIYSL